MPLKKQVGENHAPKSQLRFLILTSTQVCKKTPYFALGFSFIPRLYAQGIILQDYHKKCLFLNIFYFLTIFYISIYLFEFTPLFSSYFSALYLAKTRFLKLCHKFVCKNLKRGVFVFICLTNDNFYYVN